MSNRQQDPKDDLRFRTHIAEPRGLQILSVILVLVIAAVYIWLIFSSKE